MNKRKHQRRFPAAALTVSLLALLFLAGCHYSLLNRGSSLAAWSPDGSRLAVCIHNAHSEAGELWLVEPESNSARILLSGEESSGMPHLLAPRWSPDGRTLYCARTTAGEGEKDDRRPATIISIDIGSGHSTEAGPIHYTGSRGSYFTSTDAFTPLADGTLAAQDLGEDHIFRLVRIDPATGATSIFTRRAGSWLVISGSPDGTQLAVASPGDAGAGTTIEIYGSDGVLATTPLELWPTGDDHDNQPALTWSPTAASLAVIVEDIPPAGSKWAHSVSASNSEETEAEDFATLIMVEPTSGAARFITGDLFGIPPVFSPDGTQLAYAASSGGRDGDSDLLLEVRVLSGLDEETDVSLPGLALPLAWSSDSSMLAYYLGLPEDDNTGTVISVAADGSGTRVVTRLQKDRLAVASPGGGRLAWISGDGAVQVIDPGTGRVLFHRGLTVTGTIQAGEDQLRQTSPEDALETWSALDKDTLDGESAARMAAGSYAALNTLGRQDEAADLLDRSAIDLTRAKEPPHAFLVLCGALSDYGFRSEAERLVEEQLLTRYPDSDEAMEALWALAALKEDEGDGEAALRHLERLLKTYPDERTEVTRALLLAALAENGGDPPQVLELAGMIIEANGDQDDPDQAAPRALALYARGSALEHQGQRDDAINAYTDALARHTGTGLADGRLLEDLCWEARLRLARSGPPAPRR